MKKFRKISALALTLVLVCLCAASAFAVTGPPINETFGNTEVSASLTVNEFNSTSLMLFDPTANEVESASISIEYEIYNRRKDDATLPGTYFTSSAYTSTIDRSRNYVRYYKSISSSTYYGISQATATFRARIVGPNYTCEFTPAPLNVHSSLFDD